jgi:hypothetical protein
MKLKMEGSLGYTFSEPFQHTDVMRIKVKWKRLSPYANENKNMNFTRYFDALREMIQQSIREIKSQGVVGIVTWAYEGFMAEYVFDKLKAIENTISPDFKNGIVTWSMFFGESDNLKRFSNSDIYTKKRLKPNEDLFTLRQTLHSIA